MRRKESAIEHALRRFRVWEMDFPEKDFPGTCAATALWRAPYPLADAVLFKGAIYLLAAQGDSFTIFRFDVKTKQAGVAAKGVKYRGAFPRLHVSERFLVISSESAVPVKIDRKTGQTATLDFGGTRPESVALLQDSLYCWFRDERFLLKTDLVTGSKATVASKLSRPGNVEKNIATMNQPWCYASLADPQRDRIYFFFCVYKVAGGSKTPGGMYILDGKTGQLAFSGWEFPDMVRVFYPLSDTEFILCGGAFVYRYDAVRNRMEILLRLRDDRAESDFFMEQFLAKYHYRLPLAIGPGALDINQFNGGRGHFPYRDYLWGERMGDAIDLKTGKIFYVKIPPFR